MDYRESMVVEKWKDVSTEDVKIIMGFTKSMLKIKSKSFNFYIGLMFFMLIPTVIVFLNKFSINSVFLFTIIFCSYYLIWKIFFEKKFYNTQNEEQIKIQLEEFETVIKYR